MSDAKKKVLFITTKNLDYLRNVQELEILKEKSEYVDVIGSSAKSYVKRLFYVYRKLFFQKCSSYDLIFIGFAPQLILPTFGWKFRHNKVVIDFFISVYDTMIFDRKKWKPESIMAKLCKWVDRKTLEGAEEVISDTRAHGDYFSEEFGVDRNRIKTLYLKADTSIYYARKQQKPEKWKDKFVVVYFGSILPLQGVDIILEAIEPLKQEDIQFVIIGPLEEKISKPCNENILYIEWLPQNELAEYISYADLCLAGHFCDDIDKAKRTIPGKAYIYRAMEKPVILGDNKANRELYDEQEQGIHFVKMGNPGLLREKILECKEDWKRESKEENQ